MIKLIVLDVDGVIVGNKNGFNFPYPNNKVLSALKRVRTAGIPIILCSAKYHSSIEPIIRKAGLDNPHITNAGALIINPLAGVSSAFAINKDTVTEILKTCLKNNIYIEAYAEKDYLIPNASFSGETNKRTAVLQKEPIVSDSIIEKAEKDDIIKMIAVAFDEKSKQKIQERLNKYKNKAKLFWSKHPATLPWEYMVITKSEVSKANALVDIAKDLGIDLKDTLGVGDTMSDWEFMLLCGYVGVMGDASSELKNLAKTKGKGKYLIAPTVDEDGILNIFDYFLSKTV